MQQIPSWYKLHWLDPTALTRVYQKCIKTNDFINRCVTPHGNYTLDNGELRERRSINIHLHRQQRYVKLLYTPHRVSSSSDRILATAVWQLCCRVRLHAVCNQEFAFPSQESFFRCGCCCDVIISTSEAETQRILSLASLPDCKIWTSYLVFLSCFPVHWTFINQNTFTWEAKVFFSNLVFWKTN